MALKAGRVGVAKDQVDEFGHITGGGTPENVYTKSQCDNKFELKSHIGGLKFRNNDGTGEYQTPNGEWTPFSSGSDGFSKASLTPNGNVCTVEQDMLRKQDGMCFMLGRIHFNSSSSSTPIAYIPEGYRPKYNLDFYVDISGTSFRMTIESSNGAIRVASDHSNEDCDICVGWLL